VGIVIRNVHKKKRTLEEETDTQPYAPAGSDSHFRMTGGRAHEEHLAAS
jgi:hypothetical protein